MSKIIEGQLNASGLRVAIVAARFNEFIVDSLVKGAEDCLVRHGAKASDIHLVKVPGAFEIPVTLKHLASSDDYDAIIALGAVIRGATPHFEYVSGACTNGIAKVALDSGKPIANGVITVNSIEQAIERAGTKAGNKGAEAALGAIEMASILRQL
ncbi:MAG: 6,7-dimethyl-8-ribityllumazine synthase [Gammaproteobacteria bacterium]|nr:6,7-dimethyl-8-ribityllumazine synthase [Gammaproteobacteria bacterium]NNC97715.1 6,7-dimethyl-8-ribityllumazine synthase [Gammaproteobacteria bacterium]NNM14051.1 6,7-dimethyl-8-ribityllumazine synthase [Gammaproteobacteria bacterium]